MKKALIIVMAFCMVLAFCSCGSDEETEQSQLTPTDIQVEDADGVNVYSVIYDIDNTDTDAWSGYDTNEDEVQAAIDGIKDCKARDDWKDGSIVYGYAQEPLLKNMMYGYGVDGDYSVIQLYQVGIYNDSYTLQGELD